MGPLGIEGCLDGYAKSCSGESPTDFPFPQYNYIFKDTYGYLIYQEQLSRLSIDMCGFTGPESDELRKACAKKNREALLSLRDKFIDGAVTKGHDRDDVASLFDSMEEFSRYSFCLAHGIAYAHLTYFTAYLKTNYPSEFFAACISLEEDPVQKSKYIMDARRNGLEVYPPDINQSKNDFSISGNGSILFGFNGIKGLGPAVVNKILASRPFNSFGDFLVKSINIKGINKKSIEALICSGSLDAFGYKRSCMMRSFEKFILDISSNGKIKVIDKVTADKFIADQDSYFIDASFQEFSIFDILSYEKLLLGIYVSGDPFELIKGTIKEDLSTYSRSCAKLEHMTKTIAYLLVEVIKVKQIVTGKGDQMAFLDCMDSSGETFSLTMFPSIYSKYSNLLAAGVYLLANISFSSSQRGIDCLVMSMESVGDRIRHIDVKTANRAAKSMEMHIVGAPATVRIKTILSKLEQYESADSSTFIDLYVDIGKTKFFIKRILMSVLNIDTIRDLNKIPDIYISSSNARKIDTY